MAKRRKHRSSALAGFNTTGVTNYAKKGLALVAGIAAGSLINKFIAKKDAVSGTDLLGLDGTTSKFTTPAIVVGVGMAAHALCKNENLKTVALGIGAAGGANLINSALGENKISLSGTNDEPMIPGVGSDKILFDELPSQNQQETTYNDKFGDVESDVDFAGVDDETVGEAKVLL
ncbi:MAG: hypothetical protein MJ197_03585 [Bacteroidales bacterium]|nr:hypothetical protein [Bacteroidales bacterium]